MAGQKYCNILVRTLMVIGIMHMDVITFVSADPSIGLDGQYQTGSSSTTAVQYSLRGPAENTRYVDDEKTGALITDSRSSDIGLELGARFLQGANSTNATANTTDAPTFVPSSSPVTFAPTNTPSITPTESSPTGAGEVIDKSNEIAIIIVSVLSVFCFFGIIALIILWRRDDFEKKDKYESSKHDINPDEIGVGRDPIPSFLSMTSERTVSGHYDNLIEKGKTDPDADSHLVKLMRGQRHERNIKRKKIKEAIKKMAQGKAPSF